MTEIEELKKELEKTQLAYQMAAQMSDFKATFLARTSHELRSPLSSLIGLHQLILADLCESPEEQKEFITQAYQSALKLMKLIDEIVTVSKTEYGTNRLILEPILLEELLNYVYKLTYLQAANRNLKLNIIPPEEPFAMYADRARLVQSVVNIIDGGILLMKEGSIEVTADSLPESKISRIIIKLDCPLEAWQQEHNSDETQPETDIEKIKTNHQNRTLSPGMKILLSQTLIETMGGSLEKTNISTENNRTSRTKLILSCPQPE